MSAGFAHVIAGVSFETVNRPLPEDAANDESPANETLTPVGYDPALMPANEALLIVATPLAFVTAVPTEFPFNEKDRVFPLTPVELEVSVADTDAVPR